MSVSQDPLVFLLMLVTIGPCVLNYMSCFISQSLHSFTEVTLKILSKECYFYVNQSGIGVDVLPISDNNGQLGTVVFLGNWMPWVLALLGSLIFFLIY
jgi:hypothetical protein